MIELRPYQVVFVRAVHQALREVRQVEGDIGVVLTLRQRNATLTGA